MDPREWYDANLDLARADGNALDRQRRAVIAILNEPRESDDVDAVMQRGSDVMGALEAWNSAQQQREQMRQRLNGARVVQRSTTSGNDGGNGGTGGDSDGGSSDDDSSPRLRVITATRAAHAVASAPQLRGYVGGKIHVHVEGRTAHSELEQRALFTSGDYPSQPVRLPGILQSTPDAPTTLLDVIDRQNMTTNSIEYVQETAAPGAAAPVAEGGVKPESTFALSLQTANASTIAHWVNITRQALEDEAQIEGYVRGRLAYGLFAATNTQILSGNGTAPNLRGILNTSGIGTYAAPAGEDPLISVRKARTTAELSGFPPDTVVLNPVDWERVELSQTTEGAFRLVQNAAAGAAQRLWGLAVVASVNIAGSTGALDGGGTFVVGGFRQGATLWERTGVDFYVTDSHASNFTSNILTLLAELRAALTVWRPAAFVRGTFDDGV